MAKNTCSRPFIIVRFHDLHASDIRGVVGEITSYHKRGLTLSFLVHVGYPSFGLSLAFHFVFCLMVPTIDYFIGFLPSFIDRHFFQFFEIGVGGNHPRWI